ncbi:MAG: type 4a pilus biogenesis protein PilO [Candidatus Binatia bacterium]|nr:type 4a pilus biogenesis protein PilO [Candidatus Binatia bacterium]
MNQISEFFDNLEPSRKLAIVIAVPILILLAYYVFMLGPRMSRTAGLRERIGEMLEERDRKQIETARFADREQQVAELDRKLQTAITRLPDEKEIPELLSSISSLGRDSGLDILIFRQKPEGYQEFYAEVPVDMQVRGTYHQVASFFDEVAKLDRIVNVSNIVLRDPKIADDDLLLEANSTVTTFRFLSDKERERLIEQKKIKGEKR